MLAHARLLHHEVELLPVDVDPVEVCVEHEVRHLLRNRVGVETRARGPFRRAECGYNECDTGLVIALLDEKTLIRRERRPGGRLVVWAVGEEEREVADSGEGLAEGYIQTEGIIHLQDVETFDEGEVGHDTFVGSLAIHHELGTGRDRRASIVSATVRESASVSMCPWGVERGGENRRSDHQGPSGERKKTR